LNLQFTKTANRGFNLRDSARLDGAKDEAMGRHPLREGILPVVLAIMLARFLENKHFQ